MAWLRLDDKFSEHPKVLQAGPLGLAVQVGALCYCARNMTDGFIPAAVIPTLTATVARISRAAASTDWPAVLVSAGLWERAEGGFQIHDFLDFNPSREKLLAERRATAERVTRYRERHDSSGNGPRNTVTPGDVTPPPYPVPVPVPVEKRRGEEPPPASSPAPGRRPSPASLLKAWNGARGALPEAKGISSGRERAARARLNETPDLERWEAAFRRAAASPFCLGENERGWRATFDWFLRPDTLLKVEEGKYDPKTSPKADEEQRRMDDAERRRKKDLEIQARANEEARQLRALAASMPETGAPHA